jgi:HK97 family phage prohead protease
VLERALSQDLHVRSDGRTVFGIAVPYNSPTVVNDGFGPYTEVFNRGSFAKTIQERGDRVKLLVNHDRVGRLPIGRATTLREDASGLFMEARISKTVGGDEVLELIRDGAIDGFSVGFQPVKDREVDTRTIERVEVRLNEVSAVAFPAYEGALIAGVRNQHPWMSDELARYLYELLREHDEGYVLDLLRTEQPDPAPDEGADPDTSDPDEEPEAVEAAPPADEPPDEEADQVTSDTPRHSTLPEPPTAHSGTRRRLTLTEIALMTRAIHGRADEANRRTQEREHDVRALERAGRN